MRISALLFLSFLAGCDADGDGISDADEEAAGTDPDSADSDGDGLDDAAENKAGTDPLVGDSDADGLSDGDEVSAGTDPLVGDSDEDGLLDGEEAAAGTDPLASDSDEDGYTDREELSAGTDPVDASSVIYVGGWPYNPDKDAIDDPGNKARNETDTIFRRMELLDQWGDTVDLYDFLGQGKPVIIDISAMWCGPCNAFASWLSGGKDSYGLEEEFPTMREHIENEEIYWITILFDDENGNDPDVSDLERWYEAYPDPKVPVLADNNSKIADTYAQWYPYFIYVDSDGVIQATPGTKQGLSYTALEKAIKAVEQ